jgi:DNA/RNA endonuclease YhcR with UshA esterase domain
LIEKRGSSYFVDDGTGEIKVYIKQSTKIKKPAIDEGEMLVVTGIVSRVGGEIALLPRYQDDIRETKVSGIDMDNSANERNSIIKIPQGKNIFDFEKYIWFLNVVLAGAMGMLWWRKRRAVG